MLKWLIFIYKNIKLSYQFASLTSGYGLAKHGLACVCGSVDVCSTWRGAAPFAHQQVSAAVSGWDKAEAENKLKVIWYICDSGVDPRGWFGGLIPRRKKIKILFRTSLMNWLHTEGKTAPIALDCRRKPLKIKNFPGGLPLSSFNPLPVVEKLDSPLIVL